MKKLLPLFALFFSIQVNAQTSYTTIDSLIGRIKTLQAGAENLNYTEDGKTVQLSFSPDNFGVLIHNRLAYKSVYKSEGEKEIQEIIENIDLSKATALEIIERGNLGTVRMTFPPGHLKPMIFINGELQNAPEVTTLDFFCKLDANSSNPEALYGLLVDLTSNFKQETGRISSIKAQSVSSQWSALQKTVYPESLNSYAAFLKENPGSIYAAEATKKLEALKARKIKEDQRAAEAAALNDKVLSLARYGDQSYRNYKYYQQADSVLSSLMLNYKEAEIGNSRYAALKTYQPELKLRYNWNREYYQKKGMIDEYDRLVERTAMLNSDFMRKNNATVNGTMYVKATLLAIGGIATMVGGYAVIAKDDAFTPATRQGLLTYGGGGFGIGMLWTMIQSGGVKKAGRRASASQKEADNLKSSLGEVLNKRNQSLNGRSLINVN
ncbi:hypothetical protein GZH53_15030 [Flavihumibacter sp. R14]|nr:hypothetical protein [Flavihumibacter soli]